MPIGKDNGFVAVFDHLTGNGGLVQILIHHPCLWAHRPGTDDRVIRIESADPLQCHRANALHFRQAKLATNQDQVNR
ncbi:hypothetical protein D3C86_2082260 [compost metagenome]